MDEKNNVDKLETRAREVQNALNAAKTMEQVSLIRNELEEMRAYLYEGVEWWPQYDVRRGQQIVQGVEEGVDAAQERVKPRRRFRFTYSARSANPSSTEGQEKHAGFPAACKVMNRDVNLHNKTIEKDADKGNSGDASAVMKDGEMGAIIVDVQLDAPSTTSTRSADAVADLDAETNADTDVGTGGRKLRREDVAGRAVIVRGAARGMRVTLGDGALSVRLAGLTRCMIDTGAVNGPVWVSGCSSCVVLANCRQLRVHQSRDCTMRVRVIGAPVIEHCIDIRIGPLPQPQSISANTTTTTNNSNNIVAQHDGRMSQTLDEGRWRDVVDMSWLREGSSANWRAVNEDDDDDMLIN